MSTSVFFKARANDISENQIVSEVLD